MKCHRIAITMGDPLGIGPEIIVKALHLIQQHSQIEFHIIGVEKFFANEPGFFKLMKKSGVHFHEVAAAPKKITPVKAGWIAVASLALAIKFIKDGSVDTMVTAPISKEHVRLAGFKFPGHTEFLCHEFGVKHFTMMLFHSRLRVVLTTIHLPLKNIFSAITKKNILEKLELTAGALKNHFGLKSPRIAVCGLNPHAGEAGILGDEEIRIITPAIHHFQKCNKQVTVVGPVAADTVFHAALQGKYDAVLCHYHDQGLIPLKTTGFDEGVNMTLGLPFVRTSPDHGTAFDIAGRGVANPRSMVMALHAAMGLFG